MKCAMAENGGNLNTLVPCEPNFFKVLYSLDDPSFSRWDSGPGHDCAGIVAQFRTIPKFKHSISCAPRGCTRDEGRPLGVGLHEF